MEAELEEALISQVGKLSGYQMDAVRKSIKALVNTVPAKRDTFLLGVNGPDRGAIYELPYDVITDQLEALVRVRNSPQGELCEALANALVIWQDDHEDDRNILTVILLMWGLWEKQNRKLPKGETLLLFGHSARMMDKRQALFFYGGSK